MNPEFIKPLDYAIAERNNTVQRKIQENPHFTQEVDEQFKYDIQLVKYVDSLNVLLADEPSEESWRTIYRAFNFAWKLAKLAESHTGGLSGSDDLKSPDGTPESLRTKVIHDSADYLSNNPHVEMALTSAMDYITNGNDNHTQLAEMVAGVTFRQLDRSVQNQIARELSSNIDSDWENFNASVSE